MKLFAEEDTEPEKRRGPQGFSRPVKFTKANECCYNKWCNKIWFIRRASAVLNSVKLSAADCRLISRTCVAELILSGMSVSGKC